MPMRTHIQSQWVHVMPTHGVKEWRPYSPLFFAVVYEL